MASIESYTAIDFETATRSPDSICQIGLVRVEDYKIVARVSLLVQPPKNAYHHKNVQIHAIRPQDTLYSPSFDHVWLEIRKFIDDQIIVAHNADFDVNCLRSTLMYYDIVQPQFEVRCTRLIYKRGLRYLSDKYHIRLNHHDALSDAVACAKLYTLYLKRQQLPRTGSLF